MHGWLTLYFLADSEVKEKQWLKSYWCFQSCVWLDWKPFPVSHEFLLAEVSLRLNCVCSFYGQSMHREMIRAASRRWPLPGPTRPHPKPAHTGTSSRQRGDGENDRPVSDLQVITSNQTPAAARLRRGPAATTACVTTACVTTLSRSLCAFLMSSDFYFLPTFTRLCRSFCQGPAHPTASSSLSYLLLHLCPPSSSVPVTDALPIHARMNTIAAIHLHLKIVVWISTSCCYRGARDTSCKHLSIKTPLGLVSRLLRPDLLWQWHHIKIHLKESLY